MLILGVYWIENYFTKPADVVVNSLNFPQAELEENTSKGKSSLAKRGVIYSIRN